MKLITLLMIPFLFGKGPSESFEKFICDYDKVEELNFTFKKSKFIKGFKKLKDVSCAKKGHLKSIIFIVYRGEGIATSPNFSISQNKEIIKYLKNVEAGDKVEVQLYVNIEYIQKRVKMVKII